jgi:hypothetical protein
MELARWIDWEQGAPQANANARIYFGHETCERRLPPRRRAVDLAVACRDAGAQITLVTPPLSEDGLRASVRLVEDLAPRLDGLEVVCSDWGLLWHLADLRVATPVVGRLLAAQHVDPRVARMLANTGDSRPAREVVHLDGTRCELRKRSVPPALRAHYCSCWIDRPEVVAFLVGLGARRCELNNTPQGISLTRQDGWSYSLHLPEILLSVMHRCPNAGAREADIDGCRCGDPASEGAPWVCPGYPLPLVRRSNALFYHWDEMPPNLGSLPIDRIVYRVNTDSARDLGSGA